MKPLTAAERQKIFGRIEGFELSDGSGIHITNDWQKKYLTSVVVPQLIGVSGAPKNGRIFWHKHGVSQLLGFFSDVEKHGLGPLVLSWAGSWVPRYVRGSSSTLSSHAHGTAFDINAAWNPLKAKPALAGTRGSVIELVPLAQANGFFWGGHFSRPDGMHFELMGVDQ